MENVINSIVIKAGKRNNPYLELVEEQVCAVKKSRKKEEDSLIPIYPPYPFERLAELYELNSYHSRAIQLKAALTCMNGVSIVSSEGGKGEGETYRKISDWINRHSDYTGCAFSTTVYNFCLDREIFGNAFLEIARDSGGNITGFFHLPARNCRLIKEYGELKLVQEIEGERSGFLPFGRGREGVNEFIMLKSYHPKSVYYGLPDYIASMAAIVLDRSAVKFNIKRFDNNLVMEHIITVVGASFGTNARRDIKEFFTNNFAGLDNAGKSLLLEVDSRNKNEVGIDVHKVSAEIKEGSYLDLRKELKEEILAAHGVPPRLAGIASPGQLGAGAEVKEQLRMFRDIIIKPRQKEIEFIFNNMILKQIFPQNREWKIKFESFDISDAVEDAKFYETIMNIQDEKGRKVLSSEEIREELGYEPVR